ncbi:MAG: hypothetical protein KBD01_12415 [Acidobacteria bacterium]|nr:hypothetical protein [Acidobacteriota bacterium]
MREPAPITTPRDQRLEQFRRGRLPLAVWIAAILACALLLALRASRVEVVGADVPRSVRATTEDPGLVAREAPGLHVAVPALQVAGDSEPNPRHP